MGMRGMQRTELRARKNPASFYGVRPAFWGLAFISARGLFPTDLKSLVFLLLSVSSFKCLLRAQVVPGLPVRKEVRSRRRVSALLFFKPLSKRAESSPIPLPLLGSPWHAIHSPANVYAWPQKVAECEIQFSSDQTFHNLSPSF